MRKFGLLLLTFGLYSCGDWVDSPPVQFTLDVICPDDTLVVTDTIHMHHHHTDTIFIMGISK